MIPASALMQEAARYSRALAAAVDIYHGSVLISESVGIVGGDVTSDRGSKDRMNANVELALYPWEDTGIDTRHCLFKIRRGVTTLGYQEWMNVGTFRVDEVRRSEAGRITLVGAGIESFVIDARFIRPRTPPYGQSTTGQITQLIKEVIPSATVLVRATRNKIITSRAPWERERWDAIEALATSISAEVYADNEGRFVIANAPVLTTGAPVFFINEGDGGVLVARDTTDSRDQVYNAVSVSGQSSDPNVPPVWGWAYDMNPNSDTYYYADPFSAAGGFGQVPRFYSSSFFTSSAQCVATAQELLAQSLAANKTLSFSTVPLSFLEPGDLVQVEMEDHSVEVHMLQSTRLSLGIDSTFECTTLASKVAAREDL